VSFVPFVVIPFGKIGARTWLDSLFGGRIVSEETPHQYYCPGPNHKLLTVPTEATRHCSGGVIACYPGTLGDLVKKRQAFTYERREGGGTEGDLYKNTAGRKSGSFRAFWGWGVVI
jgi:hypothetical protein